MKNNGAETDFSLPPCLIWYGIEKKCSQKMPEFSMIVQLNSTQGTILILPDDVQNLAHDMVY